MCLTRRNGIFSADQGASISPRGKQLHFGGKQAAGVNGGPRTPRTAGKRLRPAHREASLSPGRFADIAEWSWLVLVGKGAHARGRTGPPRPLQVCVEDPVVGEGASLQLLKKPRLGASCAGTPSCRHTVRPHARCQRGRPHQDGPLLPAPSLSPAQSASHVPEALASLARGWQVGGGGSTLNLPLISPGAPCRWQEAARAAPDMLIKEPIIQLHPLPHPLWSPPDGFDFDASDLSVKWAGLCVRPPQGPGGNDN